MIVKAIKYPSCFLALFAGLYAPAQELMLATYQYADNNRLQNIRPLAEHLQKTTGVKVNVKSYPTVHAFIEGIQKNEADIALINTFGYFLLNASQKEYNMRPVLALQVKPGTKDNYTTAFVAPASSLIGSLNDIPQYTSQTKLMLVSPGSTSGNLVPRLALSSIGIPEPEKTFLSVAYGKTHAGAIDSVANGKATLAAMGSAEYFSFISKPGNENKIKSIWLSPEIPLGPVLLKKSISKKLRKKIIRCFLQVHLQNNMALQKVKEGWSEAKHAEKYILIKDSYYNPFHNQLGKEEDLKKILEKFAN